MPLRAPRQDLLKQLKSPRRPGLSMAGPCYGPSSGSLQEVMALNLTPCVYPLIPITVSYFGGQAAKGGEGQGKLVAHGLCYMMGLALTNSVLGVVASLTGGLMGLCFKTPSSYCRGCRSRLLATVSVQRD